MLRLLVLVLVLANAAYFGWAHGLLREATGFAPVPQTEPERVADQVRPTALRVLSADETRRLDAPGGARAPDCLQAGLFDDGQAQGLRTVLEGGWPQGTWQFEPTVQPARWMIYMGRYPDTDTLARKKAELRALQVLFQQLPNSAMEPGISLGSFDSQDAATQQLTQLSKRGVRTAKVVQERPEVRGQLLRLPTVDDVLRGRLDELKPALAGKSLRACR